MCLCVFHKPKEIFKMKLCQPMELYVVALILISNHPFGYMAKIVPPYTTKPTKIGNDSTALEFILLHNNDLHGRFDESSFFRTVCTDDDVRQNKCFGGFPRIATVVKQYRNAYHNGSGLPVLFTNSGDTYTGTPWFFLFKDEITTDLMNALRPDVGCLGNHEFAYGLKGLLPFLDGINFPMVISNLNVSDNHPLWQTPSLKRSVVLNVNGTRVGFVGYLAPDTANKTKAHWFSLTPEIDAVNNEAAKLAKDGVKIIIALGHSGYPKDREVARDCPLVDVIIGAHSHSFLYTGPPPEPDPVNGPYPTVIEQANGKKVLIVQAYQRSKYLGQLQLSFDKNGNLLAWAGAPILLDNRVEKDAKMQKLLEKYRPDVESLTEDVAGVARVSLPREQCVRECSLGNMIADARVYARVQQYDGPGWTDTAISILNYGAFRKSIEKGNITRFNLAAVLPYDNELFKLDVPGHVIKAGLERSVESFPIVDGPFANEFLQVSGLKVIYDITRDHGDRVASVKALCSNCTLPIYEKLNLTKTYGIVIDHFLYSDGDGYTMFKHFHAYPLNITTLDATFNYIQHMKTVYPAVEERIQFVQHSDGKSSAATTLLSEGFVLIASLLLPYLLSIPLNLLSYI